MTKILFDFLSTSPIIVFTFLLYLSKGQLLFDIGGSLGFVTLICIIYYISLIKKNISFL